MRTSLPLSRREFTGAALAAVPVLSQAADALTLAPRDLLGGIRKEDGPAPLPGATWWVASNAKDGFACRFAPGALARAQYITADMLLDGNRMIAFTVTLQEGEEGRIFRFSFFGLNQCSLRMRLPLSLVDQNRWGIDREGAFLKPRCSGARVDLEKVDRLTFTVNRKSPEPARWCMTPLVASSAEVPLLDKPLLPKGPLIDEVGQSAIHHWPARSKSVEQVTGRIREQLERAPNLVWPAQLSRWGGWKSRRLTNGEGFFRTHKDGDRWWLADPDGYAFWSMGLDCVRVDTFAKYDGLETALTWLPEGDAKFQDCFADSLGRRYGKAISYLAANLIRALGPDNWRQKWANIALAEMRRLRFNTVGNWSEWEFAAKARFPYVRPMSFQPKRAAHIYRDFPDVYHPGFDADVEAYASQLKSTANDPAFIGYFLMNEPQWGFSSEVPAAGMLYTTSSCHTRSELARFLKGKYADRAALSKAWKLEATFEKIESGAWKGVVLTAEALNDLRDFSVRMTERYFRILSAACKKADPNHLNLGMRWAGLPPKWAVDGMKFFDVFSINCYREKAPRDTTAGIEAALKMPVMIGEWHFGALDAGLPSSGIGHLKNQADRAAAYRVYLEDAAENPNCVGAHWFTLYDQSALGRFDGENYNIGFLDICNRPYEELAKAAIQAHGRAYEVAAGKAKPFNAKLEYLPNLF